jgi:hypothetical protein
MKDLTIPELEEKIARVAGDIKKFESAGEDLLKISALQEYKKYLEYELNEAQKNRNSAAS